MGLVDSLILFVVLIHHMFISDIDENEVLKSSYRTWR